MNKLFSSPTLALVACVTVFSASAQEVKGDAKAGEGKNAMCIGCHGIAGYQASFPEIYKVPKFQVKPRPTSSLHECLQKGRAQAPSMRGISESLTDQDMADLAAYYSVSGEVQGAPACPTRRRPPAKPPSCWPRAIALLATAPTTAHRLHPVTPRLPDSIAITCTSHSRLTRGR